MAGRTGFMWLALFLLTSGESPAQDDVFQLSLEELLSLEITSASNTSEKLSEAPATVIVISREEIRERRYTQVADVLDDLPGMQVTRPYGDTYLKNYWRGYRNAIGEPFLVMVDGLVYNHLYFNTADIPLVTVPVSNIERVEVVYGPASSVYGPNAFMGVINIITIKDRVQSGSYMTIHSSVTSNTNVKPSGHRSQLDFDHYVKTIDASWFYKKDDWRLSLTGRIEDGFIDERYIGTYEFTKHRYYQDRRIWGGFVDNPNLGGQFESGLRNRALDFRAFHANTELGAQYYVLDAGYGLGYAADLVQNNSIWRRPEYSLHMRHTYAFTNSFSTRSLIRYRRSDVTNDSYFVDGYWDASRSSYVAAFSYWQSLNRSWSFFQDFDVKATDRLSLNAGVKYERKDLQKAYDITGRGPAGQPGGYEPVGSIDPSTYVFPLPPPETMQNVNRITTEDIGVYAQAKYRLTDRHIFNLGLRFDRNSKYGNSPTIRAGVVGLYNQITIKAMVGQAFQEPTPRLLYGGWTGSGSDPNLKPERSRTVELSASRTTSLWNSSLSVYWTQNEKTIVPTSQGAKNLGDRTVIGSDISSQFVWTGAGVREWRMWAYVSTLWKAEERAFREDSSGLIVDRQTVRIGDLSDIRVLVGATATINRHIRTTLLARFVGERQTVETNPIEKAVGYVVADVVVEYRDLFANGLSASLRIRNLFNTSYFHPGIREAAAGNTPGTFDVNDNYQGGSQKNYFNSLLPQPGRTIMMSLSYGF